MHPLDEALIYRMAGENKEAQWHLTDRQVHITDRATGAVVVMTPLRYQSCMDPENIKIYPVHVRTDAEGKIHFENPYQKETADPKEKKIQILPWEQEVPVGRCKPCTNCGRC